MTKWFSKIGLFSFVSIKTDLASRTSFRLKDNHEFMQTLAPRRTWKNRSVGWRGRGGSKLGSRGVDKTNSPKTRPSFSVLLEHGHDSRPENRNRQ
jgi:hypothetical protein